VNSNNRIAATLFPRDIVCLRNISKVPCIKEMMMMMMMIIIITEKSRSGLKNKQTWKCN
jgi:hypothetical protein